MTNWQPHPTRRPDVDETRLETDERFPSGPWCGFYLQPPSRQQFRTDLFLTFSDGLMTGDGTDPIGKFIIRGRYNVEDGKCRWLKTYLGQHEVFYDGYNEGRGIWGLWEIPQMQRAGFHIWPWAMRNAQEQVIQEEAPLTADTEVFTGFSSRE